VIISIKLAQRYPPGSRHPSQSSEYRSIHLVQSAGQFTVSRILFRLNPFVPRCALGHNQLLDFAASRTLLCLVLYAVLPWCWRETERGWSLTNDAIFFHWPLVLCNGVWRLGCSNVQEATRYSNLQRQCHCVSRHLATSVCLGHAHLYPASILLGHVEHYISIRIDSLGIEYNKITSNSELHPRHIKYWGKK
jgi:hypothetical protein